MLLQKDDLPWFTALHNPLKHNGCLYYPISNQPLHPHGY